MVFSVDDDRIKLIYNYSMRSSIVTACYSPESLLSGCIPLQETVSISD